MLPSMNWSCCCKPQEPSHRRPVRCYLERRQGVAQDLAPAMPRGSERPTLLSLVVSVVINGSRLFLPWFSDSNPPAEIFRKSETVFRNIGTAMFLFLGRFQSYSPKSFVRTLKGGFLHLRLEAKSRPAQLPKSPYIFVDLSSSRFGTADSDQISATDLL